MSGKPSIFYAKPNSDQGQSVSNFPIGISGLPTEPFSFSGGKKEWNFSIIIGVVVLIVFIVLYFYYVRASQAFAIANIAKGVITRR